MSRPLAALALAALASACSYNLDALRLRDGAAPPVDAPDDTGVVADDTGRDVPGIDRPDTDGPPLDVPVDTGADARPGDASMGTCSSHAVETTTPTEIGGSRVWAGSTNTAENRLSPSMGAGTGCMASNNAPERVYRYVVREGPRLVATTLGPRCSGAVDTLLYALNTCEPTGRRVLACSDDDPSAPSCAGCSGDECPNLHSTIEVNNLVPGDVVYVVVDGYGDTRGSYRLAVAENAALPAALPATGTVASRCTTCVGATGAAPVTVTFPNERDMGMTMAMPGHRIHGTRNVSLRSITGAAGRFRLQRNNLAVGAGCADATAVIDLLIQGTVVTAFTITSRTPGPSMVNVVYTTFAPIMVPVGGNVTIEYRLREISPAGCGSVDINWSEMLTNTVTLVGPT